MTTHTFDWQTEPQGSFLSWMLVAALSDMPSKQPDEFEALSDATANFTNVELKIIVSGVEVDAAYFMRRVEQTMDDAVDREVAKKLDNLVGFQELQDSVSDFEAGFKEKVRELAQENGIVMEEERW